MDSIGKIVSRHRTNASLSLVMFFLGPAFLLPGIIACLIPIPANPRVETLTDLLVNMMIRAPYIAIALGGFLTGLGLYLRTKGYFVVGEKGVRVIRAGREHDYLYRDMTETCQMYRHGKVSVGIAFRTQQEEKWVLAEGHLGNYVSFRTYLMRRYLQERVPLLLDELKNGKTLAFKKANIHGKMRQAFAFGIKGYVHAATDIVKLSKHTLSFDGHAIQIANIQQIELTTWMDNIKFTLQDGSQWNLKYTSLFDGDLLLTLLDEMRDASSPSKD